jgi:hypothetical protein
VAPSCTTSSRRRPMTTLPSVRICGGPRQRLRTFSTAAPCVPAYLRTCVPSPRQRHATAAGERTRGARLTQRGEAAPASCLRRSGCRRSHRGPEVAARTPGGPAQQHSGARCHRATLSRGSSGQRHRRAPRAPPPRCPSLLRPRAPIPRRGCLAEAHRGAASAAQRRTGAPAGERRPGARALAPPIERCCKVAHAATAGLRSAGALPSRRSGETSAAR